MAIADHEFRELSGAVVAREDRGDEGWPYSGAEGAECGEGVPGWLGEGVMDGGCEARVEVGEVG